MTRVALAGGRWIALQSVGLQLLSVLTTAVLTRLLVPEDFGIVAITTVLMGLYSLVTTVGLNASVIRRSDLDDEVLSSFFWVALLMGLVATGTLVVLAEPLASSFGEPSAAPYVAAMAPVLVINLAWSVPRALLLRSMRFGAVAAADLADFVVYGLVAIATAAAFDVGAWAVIVGRLAAAAASLALVLVLAGWRPRRVFTWAVVRKDLSFNLGFLANRVVGYAAKNIDYWVVGRALGSRALGLYYIAYVLPNVLKNRLTRVMMDVMFPILSRITDDRQRLARAYLDSTRFMALIGFPVMLGLAAVADSAVPLLLGDEYAAAAGATSIIAIASGIGMLFNASGPFFLADGVPHWSVAVNFFRLVAVAIGLAIAVNFEGIEPIAWAVLAATAIGLVVSLMLTLVRLPIGIAAALSSVAPASLASGAMVAAVVGAKRALGDVVFTWPGLVSVVLIGAAAYLGFGFIFYRSEFVKMFKNLRAAVTSSDSREPETSATLDPTSAE